MYPDVFENCRNKCIKIYKLYSSKFFSEPGVAWQAWLKKTGVLLELLTDIDMSLLIEKGFRGRTVYATHRYVNKHVEKKIMIKHYVIISYVFRTKQFVWKNCLKWF